MTQKRSYEQKKAKEDPPGIYRIIHMGTGCFYIGVARMLDRGSRCMLAALKRGCFTNAELQRLYGLTPEVTLEKRNTISIEEAFELKKQWLEEALKTTPKLLLNIGKFAHQGSRGLNLSAKVDYSVPMNAAVVEEEMAAEEELDVTIPRGLRYNQPVIIEEVEYMSIFHVARSLSISSQTVYERLISSSERWAYWDFKFPDCLLPYDIHPTRPANQMSAWL